MDNSQGIFQSSLITRLGAALLIAATVFVALQALNALVNFNELTPGNQNVISVSGEGKASAVPDLATVSFTVSEDGDTAAAAQDAAAKKINAALATLKDLKIADKDIQTSSYNVYPKYSSSQPCVYQGANGYYPPCPPSDQKIIGYTASETVTVKIHDVNAVGGVVSALGGAGISNLNGPNFSVENPDAVQASARKDAIDQVHTKAEELAKELGVRLVRVVNYSENGGGYPYPMAYKTEAAGATADSRAVPEVPTGENDVTVDVSITYEIR